VIDVCDVECDKGNVWVWVAVANQGYNDVDDDFDLEIWGDTDSGWQLLHTERWTGTVSQGTKSEGLELQLSGVPSPLYDIMAMVDGGDDSSLSAVDECHEDNNTAEWGALICL
jgi:hypothetical protein